MENFITINKNLLPLIESWEAKLLSLSNDVITQRRNSQNRNIKQIVGHMIDSASNNTHRIVHLQYRESPLEFPNYATYGNNDKWIAIQNYESEDWQNLVQLWKYLHLHILHVIENIDEQKLDNEWIADVNKKVTLRDMVIDFPRHFELHIGEMEQLLMQ